MRGHSLLRSLSGGSPLRRLHRAGVVALLAGVLSTPSAVADETSFPETFWCVTGTSEPLRIRQADGFRDASCEGEIFLEAESVWGHRATADAERAEVEPGATIDLTLRGGKGASFPAAFVAHGLKSVDGEDAVERILCRWHSAETGEAAGYRCAAPVGTSALRLSLPGFATTRMWDLHLVRGRPLRVVRALPPAIRVTGRVDSPGLTASLLPRGLGPTVSEAVSEFAVESSSLPDGGAFELNAIAPGPYVYRLENGFGASSDVDVVVPDDAAPFVLPAIREPVEHRVEVQLDPSIDGAGEAWSLALFPAEEKATGVAVEQEADLTGWARFERVAPGQYLLLVADSSGSVWTTHDLSVVRDELIQVAFEAVAIRGRATIGDEPFVGRLVFGTTQGSRRIDVRTDRHGRFEGLLPREGSWDVEVALDEQGCERCGGTPGTIKVPSVDVEEGPSGEALVDIEIPDTLIRGRVVREERLPSGEVRRIGQRDALVLVARTSGSVRERGRQVQVWTDDEGDFEIRGVDPGESRVAATLERPPSESRWIPIRVEAGRSEPAVTLVLEEKSVVEFLVSAAGRAVGGAQVTALLDGGLSRRGVTAPDGSVSLDLASGRSGTVVVTAPGYGIALQGFRTGGRHEAPMPVALAPMAGDLSLRLDQRIFDRGWLATESGGSVPLRAIPNLTAGRVSFGEAMTVAGLASGIYSICTALGSCRQFEIFPAAVTEVDLLSTPEE